MKLILKTTNGNPTPIAVKRNASIKYMFKALLMNNYDVIEDAFINAKDKDKLIFITKISTLFCSKQKSDENGGEWILPEEMDATWFNPEEIGSVSRRRQRNEKNYCLAMNDLNYTHRIEWQNVRDVMEECNRANVEKDEMRRMLEKQIDSYYKMVREDKDRLNDIFRELREFYDQQLELARQQFNDNPAAPEFPTDNVKTEVINLAIPSFPQRHNDNNQPMPMKNQGAVYR